MYDWANSAFWTTVVAAVFPIYFARVAASGLDPETAAFRFGIGTDTQVDDYGWFIDDVRIYSCGVLTNKTYLPNLIRR